MALAFSCANKMIHGPKFLAVKHLALYHHLHGDFFKTKVNHASAIWFNSCCLTKTVKKNHSKLDGH